MPFQTTVMSDVEAEDEADFNVVDSSVVAVATDVETPPVNEGQSVVGVKADQSWMLRSCEQGAPSIGSLTQECALLNTRVSTLEEVIRELKMCAALQPSHSAHDDAMAHRITTLEEEMKDLKTTAASQHSHSAAALQPLLYAEVVPVAHRVGALEKDMRDLKTNAASQCVPHRVGALEAEMKDLKNSAQTKSSSFASASQQPQDGASSVLPQKRKSCPQYRVPTFKPMRVNSGKCQWCKRCWSKEEFQANYDLDKFA